MAIQTTPIYDAVNLENTKQPVLILKIEGVPYVFSSAQAYTKVRYDDPGVLYNGVYVYDGLRPITNDKAKNYIDRKGSMSTISQKLEQWDGRASVETMNIKLVDVNGLLIPLLAPGIILNDILNKQVKVYFGYNNISYPDDFIRIFSGYINEYKASPGAVQFIFTDPSSKRKQEIFNPATATLTADIDTVATTLFVNTNTLFYQTILDGKGNSDPAVVVGLMMNNEIITYTNASINSNGIQLDGVVRGALGTTPDTHSNGDSIDMFIQLSDNPINLALKIMLSGWGGPCFQNIGLRGIINTDDGHLIPDTITFEQGVDLVRDYGLALGDFVTLSSSPNSPNNATFTVQEFFNENRTISVVESGILVQENPPGTGDLPTIAAFRSQYDTLPDLAGIGLTLDEVDVAQHTYLRDTFVSYQYTLQVKNSEQSGKDFIETEIMKCISGYSLTQGARISMGLTHPPLSTQLTKKIDHTNVIKPNEILVDRGLNNRFFYNEIIFNYGFDLPSGNFLNSITIEDAESQNKLQQVSTLQIDCKGFPDTPQSATIIKQICQRLLLRYRFAAETIDIQTKFGTGHTIDAGDIVILSDQKINGIPIPILQIANTQDGTRGIYDRVMEVQERSIMLTDGTAKLRLLSNNGFFLTDRYAVVSPSSIIQSVDASAPTQIFTIKESFGGRYPGQEWRKWQPFQGLLIKIHSLDFTRSAVRTFTLDLANPFVIHVGSPLPFTPLPGDVIELANYDESSAISQSQVKSPFTYLSRTGIIATGSSTTVFVLQTGQGTNYIPGNIVYVSSPDGSRLSPDLKILTVVGDTITVGQILVGGFNNIGFTPSPGDFMKLGGFKDGGQSYRYV